jgi:hypothetical protein
MTDNNNQEHLADELSDDDGKPVKRERTGEEYADKGGHGERHKLQQQKRAEERDERRRNR